MVVRAVLNRELGDGAGGRAVAIRDDHGVSTGVGQSHIVQGQGGASRAGDRPAVEAPLISHGQGRSDADGKGDIGSFAHGLALGPGRNFRRSRAANRVSAASDRA